MMITPQFLPTVAFLQHRFGENRCNVYGIRSMFNEANSVSWPFGADRFRAGIRRRSSRPGQGPVYADRAALYLGRLLYRPQWRLRLRPEPVDFALIHSRWLFHQWRDCRRDDWRQLPVATIRHRPRG